MTSLCPIDHATEAALLVEMPERVVMPERMRRLPRDPQRPQFPVPFFATWNDGKPDFRLTEPKRVVECVRGSLCWLCGQPLGRFKTFVIGPMCAVNRISSEPPSHRDCAEYAARVCPFLTQPKMRRNEKDLPDQKSTPGIMIARNPGVTLLWTTKSYTYFPHGGGLLFQIGDPCHHEWLTEGRTATRAEVLASFTSGLELLADSARREGPHAEAELEKAIRIAWPLLPEEADEPAQGGRE